MNVYIDAEYFEVLEKQYEAEKGNFISTSANNLRAVFNLLTALNMHTTISHNELVKYAKGLAGNKNYSSLKDVIISQSINRQKLNRISSIEKVVDYNGFYFVKNKFPEANNVIVKDETFDFKSFYENCTVPVYSYTGDIAELKQFIPPANAMIISDPYIFDEPSDVKIGKVRDFLNLTKAECRDIPFQLSILTRTENINQVRRGFEELQQIDNLEIQIITLSRRECERDRNMFTNYTAITIPHPFENNRTTFNQNFLAVENDVLRISTNYISYKNQLNEIESKINTTPEYIGVVQHRWENAKFTNRLFK
ncbi:MAG: hypothetical protein IPL09_07590 [Bacteroidetes bacterium]|nr:hypothetical protein [Bacteroidota bacterium]